MTPQSILQALLTNVDEGVHVVDDKGVTTLYNAQAGLNDGLKPEEVTGKHVLAVFPSLSHTTSTLLQVLATGKPILNQQQTFTNFKGARVTTINSTWPLYDQGRLVGAIEISKDVTRVRELSEQVVDLQAALLMKGRRRGASRNDARYSMSDLIGHHPSLERVKEQANRAARSGSPVLVYGETGTGKELLVHAIHGASPRRGGPLVAQNCAALPEGLLEGILFGTARGSFTGAEDRPGLFELADGGTLYLDEINSMDLNLQAKLLRVLQDGRVRRVGEAAERAVDVRVIASTNEDPETALRERRLRQDLYYRLNVVYLELPPLRERRPDIPLLCQHFLRKHSGTGAGVQELHPQVLRFFAEYDWPGNVRELEHAIRAALHMAKGAQLRLGDLPVHLQRRAGAPAVPAELGAAGLRGSLQAAEREAIERVMQECGWNVSRAARMLNMPRQTLQYRLTILGLSKPAAEE